MARPKKKESDSVPVAFTKEVVTDIEESPVKQVVYSFQSLGYLFMLGAIGAAVAWIFYLVQWVRKIYNNNAVFTAEVVDSDGAPFDQVSNRKEMFTFELMTVCFQAVVASSLIYFVFRHNYKHN